MSLRHNEHIHFYEVIAGIIMWRYNYHVYNIRHTEDPYRYECDTSIGKIYFNFWDDIELLRLADRSRENLIKGRFRRFDRFIPGVDGQRYYVELWGEKEVGYSICDHFTPIDCLPRMEQVGKMIARMHKAMKVAPISDEQATFTRWNDSFQLYIDQFIQARKGVEKLFVKSKADKMFLVNFYSIMQRARKSISLLTETNYDKVVSLAEQKSTWCHGNLYYTNIVKSKELSISGLFDGMRDIFHYDLAIFLHSLSVEYSIEQKEIEAFFKGYQSVNEINADDLKIIYAYILFPHFIWRTIYSLYLSQPETGGQKEEDEVKWEQLLESLNKQKKLERLYPLLTKLIIDTVEEEEDKKKDEQQS